MPKLSPGDMFTYDNIMALWNYRSGNGERPQKIIEVVDPHVMCIVIACLDYQLLVMPTNCTFGWVSLSSGFVKRL